MANKKASNCNTRGKTTVSIQCHDSIVNNIGFYNISNTVVVDYGKQDKG